MGKPDHQQPKLTFDAPKKSKSKEAHSDTELEMDQTANEALATTLKAIHQSLRQIDSKIDNLTHRVDCMSNKLEKHGERLDEAEDRIQSVEDESRATTSTCAKLEKTMDAMARKAEDLEARSRRNNIRIAGIPESTNTGKMELYVERLLQELFGADQFSSVFIVERAHRTLAPQPPPGTTPRPIVARLLNYRDRDQVLRLAQEKQAVLHGGNKLEFYPDYTMAVQLARKEFNPAKQKLRELGVAYTMQYPAKLRVVQDGRTHFCTTPKAAMELVKKLSTKQKQSKRTTPDPESEQEL